MIRCDDEWGDVSPFLGRYFLLLCPAPPVGRVGGYCIRPTCIGSPDHTLHARRYMGRMQYAPTSVPVSACVGQLLGYGVQTLHDAFALSGSGGTMPIDVVRQLSGVDPRSATHSV